MVIEFGYLGTYIIYLGLLFSILFLLLSKSRSVGDSGVVAFATHNKISIQDILVLILILFVVGIRYNVGVDWLAYKNYFEGFSLYKNRSFQNQNMEAGYYAINYLVNYLGGGYSMVFGIAAGISWIFILKSFPSKLLPLVVFFIFCDGYFFWSMNGVRQFVAIAIFSYSIKYILTKEFKHFALCLALASLFHYSAILLIPLYFLPYHRLYKKKWWGIAFITSFILSGTHFIISGLPKIFSFISNYVPLLAGYNGYFESKYYETVEMTGLGLGYLFRIVISFIFLIFSKSLIKKYPYLQIYFVLFFIGVIIYNLFFGLQIVSRFTNYFLFLRSYLLAALVYHFFKNKKISYMGVGIILLYFVLFWKDIFDSANQCCPYQFTF